MKRFLTLLFCVGMMWTATAQPVLTGCMGVDFRSTPEQVKMVMNAKEGVELYTNTNETVSYLNGKYGGRPLVGSVFKFYDRQLHTIVVLLEVKEKPQVMSLYQDVIDDLEKKYEVKFTKIHKFKYPYEEGDGHEVTAIKGGYATITSYCEFAEGNMLAVSINNDNLLVKVEYQLSALVQKAIEAQDQRNSKDY